MKIFSVILFCVLLIGMGCKNSNGKKQAETIDDLSAKAKTLIESISHYPTVDEQIVGIGVPSKQYANFLELSKQLTDKDLVLLTDHQSPNVRAYSFWALAKRNHVDLKSILNKHLNDTSSVNFFSGCFINRYPINKFYLTVLSPKSPFTHCAKLSKPDLDFFQDKIDYR